MPLTTVFLGSSKLAKTQARTLVKTLTSPTLALLPWWEAFTAGRTLLEELDALKGKVNGALLLFSPEAPATIDGKPQDVPNLNVLFEFGYFYGCLGRDRVAMISYGTFFLPSDLGGYIHIYGSKFFKKGKSVPVGVRTKDEFTRWIRKL